MKNILILIFLTVFFTACNIHNKGRQSEVNLNLETGLDENQEEWVERTLSELTIREMAGQVVMEWYGGGYIPVESDDFDNEIKVVDSGIGGIWFMGGGPYERAAKANELQKHAKIPLLVTGWEGLGKKLLQIAEFRYWARGGGTDLPPALAYGAIGDPVAAKEAGMILGIELRAIGDHIAGNPEVNVLLNLDNVLHNRCYGDDPVQIAQLSTAFITGIHEVGELATTGFFPGAGSIGIDPHNELAIAEDDRQTFDSIHFVPFRAAIEAGTDIIMSSHIATPALTGLDTLPATLSPKVTKILRDDLGYNGILITDAMAMGGITNNYNFIEAAILAFKAGNDMILGTSPIKFADTLAILVEKGEIPLEQLKTSVRRILELKVKIGLHNERMVSLDDINTIVGQRTHQMKADSAAFRSIVLLRDKQKYVPLEAVNSKKVLSITYERENNLSEIIDVGKEFNRIFRKHVNSVDAARISTLSDSSIYQKLIEKSENVDQVILSIYLRPELGTRVQDKMSKSLIQFVESLQSKGKEIIIVSFGELEVLNSLPDLGTFMMAWSGQDVMQRAAAKAILGLNPISGYLPINLPPFHKRGDGLERESTR